MHILRGLVRGETVRLWRTNKHTSGLHRHLQIFVDSMARRGHPRREISSLIHKQLTKLKFGSTHRHQHHNPKKSVFALLRYSRSVPIRSLQRCFRKHAPILKHVFKYDMTAGIAFKIQPNMFRTHFRDNHWH